VDPDIGLRELVDVQGFAQGFPYFIEREREPERDGFGGMLQPAEMLAEQEELAVVRAQGLVDPVAVEESVIEDRDGGCLLRDEMSFT
jgi:hypothetical protein